MGKTETREKAFLILEKGMSERPRAQKIIGAFGMRNTMCACGKTVHILQVGREPDHTALPLLSREHLYVAALPL